MRGYLFRGAAAITALSLAASPLSFAQTADPAEQAGQTGQTGQAAQTEQAEAAQFSAEQLDALLAPVALYPDDLLVQVLMASTFPLQVIQESRWLNEIGHDHLQGDALVQALEKLPWDPSVKSLAPFPQVVAMLNTDLDWMQQLGYAFATQQADVMSSVQRLRHQAQANGSLKTTEQQRVVEEDGTIGIEPANPQVVYVPIYNPTVVYGVWPYPVYQPVYIPPPFGYAPDSAFYGGLGFATGVVVVGSLFGFAKLKFHRHEVHIDVDRFNHMNVNRAAMQSEVWRPAPAGMAGRPVVPPAGPVGLVVGRTPLPPSAFGRPNVQVPGNQVNPPMQPGFHPGNQMNQSMQPGFHPDNQLNQSTQPVFHPGFQWNRPMQPVVHPPATTWNRPMQPIARPPPPVQRPADPHHGGPPMR